MARRELSLGKKASTGEEGDTPAPEAAAAEGADAEATAAADADAEGAAEEKPKAVKDTSKDTTKDIGCRRYEKMVDMAMQAANKNKTRFPLKLFGFVINVTLLMTWVALAASPLAKQAQVMAPIAVKAGCEWLEHTELVQAADHMATDLVRKAKHTLDKAASEIGEGDELKHSDSGKMMNKMAKKNSLKKLIKELVCKPLIKLAKEKAKEAADALDDMKHQGERRLLALPALAPVLQSWWNAQPGDPYMKLTAVTQLLQDLERDTYQKSSTLPIQFLPAPHNKQVAVPSDLNTWLKRHRLPDSIKAKLEAEEVDTVADVAMLTEDHINLLCHGEKIGHQTRFMLLVKAARDSRLKYDDEL